MFEIILFILSLIVNLVILVLVFKFRDLIRFLLMLRKVLKQRGYFKLTIGDLNEKVARIEKFMQPITSPEKLPKKAKARTDPAKGLYNWEDEKTTIYPSELH